MYKLCNDILATLELDGIRINKEYTFPPKQELTVRLKDILEKDVDEKYYLSDERVAGLVASTEKERAKGNGFKFEPIEKGRIAHTISTKAGGRKTDNYIAEPTIVAQRGRSNGDWHESEHFQQFELRNDGLTNTLSSVQKDNLVAEPQSALVQPVDRDYKKNGRQRQTHIEMKDDGISHNLRTNGETMVVEPMGGTDNRRH